ncbi:MULTISPECIES: GNAT family N-acetyltransferase [Ramlibacter]|uniref:GNAT family N-acetyltransferase n=1 Tax=Ramlibacter aquaticus TaxID=2780094 RepID=A0ABR9SA52_9BURK|nr:MULTISPECIES: GNAT family N-acetyltransferase [Ramlibacter]MBE7939225.1 GNAT family N-acetyltransferase [Ramlibacter aquaticus]
MDTATAAGILIRSMEPDDAAGVSALIGLPGTFEGTLQLPDMPVASRTEHFAKVDTQACKLVAVLGGRIVGSAGLYVVGGLRRAHVRSLGLALAEEVQGQGLGRRMMERLLDWADNWAQVLRIELHVHADNPRAIALYRAMGFEEEGRHRGYAFKGGRYVDGLSMARLHPSPPRIG